MATFQRTRGLGEAQREAYWRDGFTAVPDLLSAEQTRALAERMVAIAARAIPVPDLVMGRDVFEKEKVFQAGAASAAHPLDELRKINNTVTFDELFRSVAHGERVLDLVESLIGPDIYLHADQTFVKPPMQGSAKAYHQDFASWPHLPPPDGHVTVWIAMDDATLENGCLRYLRGSHKLGLLPVEHVPRLVEEMGPEAEVPVEVPAGGAIFHHGLAMHASGANQTSRRRRGWALHYMPSSVYDLRPLEPMPGYDRPVRGSANARIGRWPEGQPYF